MQPFNNSQLIDNIMVQAQAGYLGYSLGVVNLISPLKSRFNFCPHSCNLARPEHFQMYKSSLSF